MGQDLSRIIQNGGSCQQCLDVRWVAFQYRGKIPPGAAFLPGPRGIAPPLKQGSNLFLMRRTWGAILSQRSALSPISLPDP
jgi:hypothetical protein